MCQRASNRSFALIRDERAGLEFWEVWDERMPFGSCGYRIMAILHDFWFTAGDDGHWNGPYRSREHVCACQGNRQSAVADLCKIRQQVGLCAFSKTAARAHIGDLDDPAAMRIRSHA
jgi:hypothetical protein